MTSHIERGSDSANGSRTSGPAGAECSSAALFALLWDALSNLLGTAATATLVRRAAGRVARHSPGLTELTIVREGGQYRYALPPSWNEGTMHPRPAFRDLVGELVPLLVDLTGPLVVRHLAQIPALRERGIISLQEEGP